MRIIFTIIISVFFFSHVSAQQSAVDNSFESSLIRIYPNPASAQIQLTSGDKMIGNTIRIYSLLGSEMLSRSIAGSQEIIDVSALSQGLYLYNIIDKNNKTVLTGKFNKQ